MRTRLCLRARCTVAVIAVAAVLGACASRAAPPSNRPAASARAPAARGYTAYIANEASDLVTRVSFTPGAGLVVEHSVGIGEPGRIAGPHALAVSPDDRFWFVTLSHGIPSGSIAKYSAVTDTLVGRVAVGAFPESVAITPDGQYLFVANSDLNGREIVSSVSVVFAPTMTEVARPNTCVRPAGGRVNAAGTKYYSTCTASDQLVEIDTRTFRVTNRFAMTPGQERELGIDTRGSARRGSLSGCAPAWAEPGRATSARFIYVACTRSDQVVEIDAVLWQVTRRFDAHGKPYHLALDPTGSMLLATMHGDSTLLAIDLHGANPTARIRLSQSDAHGVAVTADGRYAFVTNEGAGRARGTLDVIDLARMVIAASAELAYAPGGIDLLTRPQRSRR